MTMTLSEELTWRGFINQTTFRDITELDKKHWTFYHGFDASADSQTVGNLAAMMFDKVFLRHGHTAFVLAGGATSLLGDPGGKDSERTLQGEEIIAHNIACAEAQLKQIYTGHKFTMVNNIDWYKDMNVLQFMRNVGKHFSMTPLVQRDYIAKRMGEGGTGISYTEFSYTLLQGYDFLHLHEQYAVNLQLAGADQWGNSISGVDLIRRVTGHEAHIMTLPLIINKATGKKFGKSEAGAVWLDPVKTTPTQFYQFWVNVDDEGVEGYLKVFTELDKPAVDEIMAKHQQNPRERFAQTRLAQEVTSIVHGAMQTKIAEQVTAYLTAKKQISEATEEELVALRKEIPATVSQPGGDLLDVLVATQLASSKSEARRLLTGNAIAINGQKTTQETLQEQDFSGGRLLIRKGKAFKDSALVERTSN